MTTRHAAIVLAVVMLSPCVAAAAPVIIPLDGDDDLLGQGFEHLQSGGTSTFEAGMLTIDAGGAEEWSLEAPASSKWWDEVLPEKGWWVEVRLRIDDADADCLTGAGPGLWIHDRGKLIQILFTLETVTSATTGVSAAFDTSEFHVYRVEDYGDGTRQLLVDGDPLLDLGGEIFLYGTETLMFGDLGGCLHSHTVWDYFAYDTFAPGGEDGDADGDGIPNAEDDCFETADPDQLDSDGDARGDVCDPCPMAPRDDRDGDGVCDNDDACPDDANFTDEPCPGPLTLDGGVDASSVSLESGSMDGDSLEDTTAGGSTSVAASTSGIDGGGVASGRDDSGCGCTTRSPGGVALVMLLALVFRTRRR